MTVIHVIWVHRSLCEPMYVFIAALLLNSVLLSTNIYPKLLLDLLSDRPMVSYSACLLQFHMFYSLGGSEFLLLAATSYEDGGGHRAAAGVAAACVSRGCGYGSERPVKLCSHILPGAFCNNAIHKLHCKTRVQRPVLDMVITVNMAVLPLLFTLFGYSKILLICGRSNGAVRRKAACTGLPHLAVLITFSCWCMYDVTRVQVESHLPMMLSFMMSLQVVLYNPLLNPIIYGLKMKEISKHLTSLLGSAKYCKK